MIKVKNHHILPAIRVETALKQFKWIENGYVQINSEFRFNVTYIGAISEPWVSTLPNVNQNEFAKVNWLSNVSGSSMHG